MTLKEERMEEGTEKKRGNGIIIKKKVDTIGMI